MRINAIELQRRMKAEGHELSNEEAEILAEAANTAIQNVEFAEERRADVAAYCQDLRECGHWDGE